MIVFSGGDEGNIFGGWGLLCFFFGVSACYSFFVWMFPWVHGRSSCVCPLFRRRLTPHSSSHMRSPQAFNLF